MREHSLPFITIPAAGWLADTTSLTLAEQGLLFRALVVTWRDGPLPADPARLARTLGVSGPDLKKSRGALTGHFQQESDQLVCRRLEAEYTRALDAKLRKRAGALHTNAALGRVGKRSPARTLSESLSPAASGTLSDSPSSSSSSSTEEISERVWRLIRANPAASNSEIARLLPHDHLSADQVAEIRKVVR